MSDRKLSPGQIRRIRGKRSRAKFGALLGVTQLTVYRWELPEDAKESRYPRKAMEDRILQLAKSEQDGGTKTPYRPSVPLFDEGSAALQTYENPLAPPVYSVPEPNPDEVLELQPVFEMILAARFQEAEKAVFQMLSSAKLQSPGARSAGQVALILLHLFTRNDIRGAYALLVPLLRELDDGRLPRSGRLRVYLASCMVFASPDGSVFNPGRVNAGVTKINHYIVDSDLQDKIVLAKIAEIWSAYHLGDLSLFRQLVTTNSARLRQASFPVSRLLAEELFAIQDMLEGRLSDAAEALLTVADQARRLGFYLLEIRSLSFLSYLQLGQVVPADDILDNIHRCHEITRAARLMHGFHDILLAAAESQVYIRLMKLDRVEPVIEGAMATAADFGWPPVELVNSIGRFYHQRFNLEGLRHYLARFREIDSGHRRALREAAELFLEGTLALGTDSLYAASETFDRSRQRAEDGGTNPYMALYSAITCFNAAVLDGEPTRAGEALRNAEKLLERHPYRWLEAMLRLFQGTRSAMEMDVEDAALHIEAAIHIWEEAKDLPFLTLARHLRAFSHVVMNQPGADQEIEETEAEYARALGAVPIAFSKTKAMELAGMFRHRRREAAPEFELRNLLLPLEHLAARGLTADQIHRELLSILAEIRPDRTIVLEELSLQGRTTPLQSVGPSTDHPLESFFEYGDGCGRRFRLGFTDRVNAGERSLLRMLTNVASLSLEVNCLRSSSDTADAGDGAVDLPDLHGVIAASPQMRKLLAEIARLKQSRANVLIHGESGAGKEVIARAIHDLSARADRPYVTFNCSSVPRDLFEGQLFGYRKGSFTGATSSHPGVIRSADGGTLFLDEIADLPLNVQPKMLRFLENGEVFPLGETRPVKVDVRIIAASNQELEKMVRENQFREDLFYRLQVVPIRIPPLRERKEDIVALARHFIRTYSLDQGQDVALAPDAVAKLQSHAWPGNVRELRNVIERALAYTPLPKAITADLLRM